jgi:hypothetical protein
MEARFHDVEENVAEDRVERAANEEGEVRQQLPQPDLLGHRPGKVSARNGSGLNYRDSGD